MKRRLGDCTGSDGGGGRPAGSSQYPAEALPQPLLSWTCPRWAFLLQELSPSRFVAASVCTDSLALVSLQVVDRAISASAMGMEVLKSSAVSSATALFAECIGAGRCACRNPSCLSALVLVLSPPRGLSPAQWKRTNPFARSHKTPRHPLPHSLPLISPHWVAPTEASAQVLCRLLGFLELELQGSSAGLGGFVSAGWGLVASAEAGHLRDSLARAQKAWNLTSYSLLRVAPPGGAAAAPTFGGEGAPHTPPCSDWGGVSALLTGKVGLGAAVNILLPRAPSTTGMGAQGGVGHLPPSPLALAVSRLGGFAPTGSPLLSTPAQQHLHPPFWQQKGSAPEAGRVEVGSPSFSGGGAGGTMDGEGF